MPEEGDFPLNLPVGPPGPSAQAALFAAHDRAVPRASPWAARISPDGTLCVQGPELSPATVTDAWFIPDQPSRIQDDAAQPLSVRAGGFTLALKLAKGFSGAPDLSGVLSVRDRAGMQTDVKLHAMPGPPPPPAMPPLGQILVFAFLGGLILNLMPCVFPVLAMKAVGLAQARRARARTCGVLHRRRAGDLRRRWRARCWPRGRPGTAAGWGFQFASPVFVAAMAWLLFAVGLNLSGVFQVGGGLAGAGSALADGTAWRRQLLHRAAGGAGGDALHRAVHGRGGRRRAGRASGGDAAGVRGDGAGAGRALCGAGLGAGAGPAGAAAGAAGWRC